MSYTVLARKYRSRTLDEVIGQEPIVTTLKNAISSGRVHHGYLFCGTRGVGKTSTARVLAKSLNCLESPGPTVQPCLKCDSCASIAVGEDLDVLEIDAASNTGVDNIRELRSNAGLRPARSRFKIYIIDEVHMLSSGAFNALLKTLEEPPGHVKFIFATTELHKVPLTIQSRVQRFEFQSIPVDQIADQLRAILKTEGIEADDTVIRRVARYANGSMRDGLSLLDQLLALGSARLDAALVDEVLPSSHDEKLAVLVGHLASGDAAATLNAADVYLSTGQTLERFCERLIDHLRALMLINVCGAETDLVDVPTSVREGVVVQSKSFDAQTYVYMIAVLEELRRQVQNSAAARSLTDAAMVRLASAKNFSSIPGILSELGGAAAPGAKKKFADPQPAVRPPGLMAPPGGASAPEVKRIPGVGPVRPLDRSTTAAGPSISSREVSLARSDPLVREALNLFEGTLMNVERVASGAAQRPEQRLSEEGEE